MKTQTAAYAADDTEAGTYFRAEHVTKTFPLYGGVLRRRVGEVKAVQDVSISVARGRTLGIVGESGSGKTTLGRIMAALEPATSGSLQIDVDGRLEQIHVRSRAEQLAFRRRVQMVFQDPYTSMNPRLSVGAAFHEPLLVHGVRDRAERRRIIHGVLDTVGMSAESMDRYPHEFSGGQRQRLSIARALTLEPELLILDESVSALDVSIQAQVLNLLKDIQREYGMAFVFIGHDLSIVKYMSDDVLVMRRGEAVERLPARSLLHSANEYTRRLIDAIPSAKPSSSTH